MSGFEHYARELAALDHEITHYAAACGIDLALPQALEVFFASHRNDPACQRSRESLYGLLQLRLKIETEMLELGLHAPPYQAPPRSGTTG